MTANILSDVQRRRASGRDGWFQSVAKDWTGAASKAIEAFPVNRATRDESCVAARRLPLAVGSKGRFRPPPANYPGAGSS